MASFQFCQAEGDALWCSLCVHCCKKESPGRHYSPTQQKGKKGSLAEASFLDVFILGKLCRSQRRNSVPQLSLSTEEPGCVFENKCLCGKQGANVDISP